MKDSLPSLLKNVRACTLCEGFLPHGVRPILQANSRAKILIAGQAPGRKVHQSGIAFDDASGKRLREWLGVSSDTFYDPEQIAILPMGFCFPGTGKSGDLPPRPECEPAWRQRLLDQLPNIEMTVVLGRYAQVSYFQNSKQSLTDLVKDWQLYWPTKMPLPHPSPRNNLWLKRNPWFELELLPELQKKVSTLISQC